MRIETVRCIETKHGLETAVTAWKSVVDDAIRASIKLGEYTQRVELDLTGEEINQLIEVLVDAKVAIATKEKEEKEKQVAAVG